jgi:hypothetical protein
MDLRPEMSVFLSMKSQDYFFNQDIFPDTHRLNTFDDYQKRKYYLLDKPFIIGKSKCVRVDTPPLVMQMTNLCLTSSFNIPDGKKLVVINGERKPFLSGHELVCLNRLAGSFLDPKSLIAAKKIQFAYRRYRDKRRLNAALSIQRW